MTDDILTTEPCRHIYSDLLNFFFVVVNWFALSEWWGPRRSMALWGPSGWRYCWCCCCCWYWWWRGWLEYLDWGRPPLAVQACGMLHSSRASCAFCAAFAGKDLLTCFPVADITLGAPLSVAVWRRIHSRNSRIECGRDCLQIESAQQKIMWKLWRLTDFQIYSCMKILDIDVN